ncbi:MAG: accessory factor UbiK family protein, partial [Halioglobus sp.]|nr:accessory factor UbiK family protein [Halioglobus sp.]
DDLEENFRTVLKSSLQRMDLVTREEFEVQEAVLARTREKLEALEARLTDYEKAAAERPKTRRKAKKKAG